MLVGSMATVIGVLWRILAHYQKMETERLKRCEQMHKESQDNVVTLTQKVSYLEGRQEGVENLSNAVLRKIEQRREA